MIKQIYWKKKIIIGVVALSFASVSFQWIHNDFVGGVSFAIGLLLVLLGVSERRRNQGK